VTVPRFAVTLMPEKRITRSKWVKELARLTKNSHMNVLNELRLEPTVCHVYLLIRFELTSNTQFFNCLLEYCLLFTSYKQGLHNSMNS
jgi:hypothetical protein